MILSKQKCCHLPVLTGVSIESQKRTSVFQTKLAFFLEIWLVRINVGLVLNEAFTFLMDTIYVQSEGMVNQQIVGIHMGNTADLFWYCYERVLSLIFINLNGVTSDVRLVLYSPPHLRQCVALFAFARRIAVIRHRMICFVLGRRS